ncbi:MAG TPA: phenylalanine--tRNA ligase subunit alpha [bacterium]|nr:phenylalanine--tRNA ligase subunit alpha [bacterium]HPN33261.1 phenylalanine--tRNA ligase subunit alpha [bacterium]
MTDAFAKIQALIHNTEQEFVAQLLTVQDRQQLEQLRILYLGRKGRVQALFSSLAQLDPAERPMIGQELNRLKKEFEEKLTAKLSKAAQSAKTIEQFDYSLPGRSPASGGLHPLMQVLDEIKSIFTSMGFRIEEGPEIELDYYNFEALNIPPYHPSRDMQDTFYLDGKYVLRTHTSPVQIRTMERQKPPVRMIAPGRCFRKDTPDATHSPTFHQVEGLCVDRDISFADLKGVVQVFAQKMFGQDVRVRFRPSFFPFTEPSAEYDFSCFVCQGKGCRVCKGTGWIEISGAGMVDPAVFGFVDYDPNVYSGYAFGMGVERIAMLKYQINDIRYFFDNDLRFLEQF